LRLGAYLGPYNSLQITAPDAGERGSDFELPDASSIESRFDEIENALRRLDPTVSDEPLTLGGGEPGAGESTFQEDEPVAILTDEEYERVADESGVAGLGLRGAEPLAEGGTAEQEVAEQEPDAEAPSEPEELPKYDYHDFLQRLAMEIQRTFAGNLLRVPLDLICLTGGMAQKNEARRFFSEEFDVETISLDFEDAFEMDVDVDVRDEINRLGGVAVGLALREFGQDTCKLDFRQEPFRYERHFEKLKRPLLTMGVCLCAFFLAMIFNLIADFKYWGKLRKDIFEREVQYYEAFFEDKPDPKGKLLAKAALKEMGTWNEQLGERSGNLNIVLDDVKTLTEIASVLRTARETRKIEYEILRLDLKLSATPTTGKSKKGEPKYRIEGRSEMVLVSDATNYGSEFAQLFEQKSTMWAAVASDKKNKQGGVTITLKLEPKKDYLLSLE
jgi:hypothetical protein